MNQLKFCLTETEECLFIIPFIKNRDVVLKASQNILDNLKSIKMLKRHLSYEIWRVQTSSIEHRNHTFWRLKMKKNLGPCLHFS